MKDDLISIIIPVYNAEKFLDETINTVLNQTYKNFELILVNDGSKDKSVDVIKKHNDKRIKLIDNKNNKGAALSRNDGIRKAKGRYICFLDADDLWNKEKLEKQINFMKEKECAFSFTGYEFANENGIPNGKKVFIPKKLNYKSALKNTTISTITVMIDTKKMDKDLIYMNNVKSEDTATWWNILKNGYEAFGLNEILSFYRRSEGTLSSNKIEAIRRIWNLYRNVFKLGFFYSLYNFVFYAINAVKRRI